MGVGKKLIIGLVSVVLGLAFIFFAARAFFGSTDEEKLPDGVRPLEANDWVWHKPRGWPVPIPMQVKNLVE